MLIYTMPPNEKIVRLPPEVDIYMRERLRVMLALDECTTLIADLRDTRYIDGASIGEIVRARNLAMAAGKKVIVLVDKSSDIVRVFDAIRLFDVLDIRLCDPQHRCA